MLLLLPELAAGSDVHWLDAVDQVDGAQKAHPQMLRSSGSAVLHSILASWIWIV
ncbi:MAG: hypothetical protein ABI068_05830 [Ktedonobacterales bacterium]